MKILMMEVDPEAKMRMNDYLPDFDLELVSSLDRFEHRMRCESYHCLVVDISMMEDASATYIASIKTSNKGSGIIIISNRDSLKERIDALTIGADDFLIKPYDASELAARVVSLNRRVNMFNHSDLVYKEIRVNVSAKTAYVNGFELDLTKKEIELLLYFIEHKNSIIKKGSLIGYLSGQLKGIKSNTDVIYAHVKNLKKKLTEAGCNAYIKTIYGIGYKWDDG
jgi:DNA-binding response OmpR family regulator